VFQTSQTLLVYPKRSSNTCSTMSETLKSLVRSLLAAGTAVSEDGNGGYLLYERDGKLMQQLHTATGGGEVSRIASGVRKDTPALCLVGDDGERLAFCFDQSDLLRCFSYDEEEEEWIPENFGNIQITGHAKSQLSGCVDSNGMTIFFQNPINQLQSIHGKGSTWEIAETVPGRPAAGTGHSVIDTGEDLNLIYMGEDKNIHHQIKRADTATWEGHVVPNSTFDTLTSRLLVLELEQVGAFEIYAVAGRSVVRVNTTGERVSLGKIDGKEFVPETKEESTYHFHGNIIIKGGVLQYGDGRSRGHRSHHTHRRR